MMMVELASVPTAALPIRVLSDHLRLSSGFADDGSQDAQLEHCLRAALSAIEARIGKTLFQRQFLMTLSGSADLGAQILPVAPVVSIDVVRTITRDAVTTLADPQSYSLVPDAHRPCLKAATLHLPGLGGVIEVAFTAGFNAEWLGIPSDLQQAVLAQAAEYYGLDAGSSCEISSHVMALIAPYRAMRLGGGGT